MHQVEHQRLFVIKQAGVPVFHDLVCQVEQRRDDLYTGLVGLVVLMQEIKQLQWGCLTRNVNTRMDGFDAQPDNQLIAHLLKYGKVFVAEGDYSVLTLADREGW